MKCLCVVSSDPGHIDFGGLGFVKLAQRLSDLGHGVEWATSSYEQIRRLQAFGQIARLCPGIDSLPVKKFQLLPSPAAQDARDKRHHLHLHNFFLLLQTLQPDIILLDRILVFGVLAADALGIPYVSIGTPGGHWTRHTTGKFPGLRYDHPCFSATERVSAGTPWMRTLPRTFWVNSPYLNICFMGKSFYPDTVESAGPTAFVHHFAPASPSSARTGIGVSFGNTKSTRSRKHLKHLLFHLVADPQTPDPIHVFVGNNNSLYTDVDRQLSDNRVYLHRWVNFADYFPSLEYLAFLGGIGTVWQCLNASLPMYVFPHKGDQAYNAGRIEQLGLGQCLPHESDTLPLSAAMFGHCLSTYQAKIASFIDQENFTDTLPSVVEKITKCFHGARRT